MQPSGHSSTQQIALNLGRIGGSPVTMQFRRIPAAPEGVLMGGRGYDLDEEPWRRGAEGEPSWLGLPAAVEVTLL